tara:strand:+ start:428 stop:694 length:267 start_codon:yes stop_codon:yes gene_type:complete
MENYLVLDITNKINAIANGDGVEAVADMFPLIASVPGGAICWDIELTYKNYHFVERFNSGMAIAEEDINKVAALLLRDLFTDYYEAKL